MAYFNQDFFDFFIELAPNNHKDWFDENRTRYHQSVKEPFDAFVKDLIAEVQKIDKEVTIQPKDAIFRINRDIRFSKDKSPYKLNRSAIISKFGKKDKSYPGLYIELSPEFFRQYGGVYMPDKTQLYNIREKIAQHPKQLEKLLADQKFKSTFGALRGEKNKVIPKEFKAVGEDHDIIYNKQFYWFNETDPEIALKDDFMSKILDGYRANKELMDYFAKAMV